MPSSGGIELTQCHARAGRGPASSGVYVEPPIHHPGEVHDNALTDVAAPHSAAGTAGNERDPVLRRPADKLRQIGGVGGEGNCFWQDAIDARPFGVGGAGSDVGTVDAPDDRRRQHRQKLTIFSLYG
jgi:hypothetical protein